MSETYLPYLIKILIRGFTTGQVHHTDTRTREPTQEPKELGSAVTLATVKAM